MKQRLIVTIKRSQWLRGIGGIKSFLRDPDFPHKQCCIGFVLKAEGRTDIEITNKRVYTHVLLDDAQALHIINIDRRDKFQEADLYFINDSTSTTDEEKEKAIITNLGVLGYEVIFID